MSSWSLYRLQPSSLTCRSSRQSCQKSCLPRAQLQLGPPQNSLTPQTTASHSRCLACSKISSTIGLDRKAPSRLGGRRSLMVQARAEDLDVQDRLLGALPYIIPLLDGIRYGRYFFLQFPVAAQVLAPIRPLVSIYYSVPFLSLIVFFALYSGVVNNFSFSRHIRYNAMQAVLLSVILIFPSLLEQVFRGATGGAGLQIQISLYNTVFLFVAVCVAYASGSSLLGTAARLPLISSAADQRVL